MTRAEQSAPNIVPTYGRAGLGWLCRTCSSKWSGAKADHTAAECGRIVEREAYCPADCAGDWGADL